MDAVEFGLEPTGYPIVATFDGRVLEVFGPSSDDSRRIHVKFLSLSVSNPDKKGRRDVALTRQGGPIATNFALFGKLDDSAFETIRPLIDALTNAGVRSTE